MTDFNIDLVKQKMASQDYIGALNLCLDAINEDDPKSLVLILNYVRALLTKNIRFSVAQINRIKPLVGFYEEDVSDLAIEVYMQALGKTPEILSTELDFCLSKLDEFEVPIREKFIEFLMNVDLPQGGLEARILKGLAGRLKDNLWKIRVKVIEFFTTRLKIHPDQLKPLKNEMLNILDEIDFDVSREGMDFLLRYAMETFTPEDMNNLVITIHEKSWIAQEKILWLIGKLGSRSKDLIEEVVPNLVRLLDFDDFLVQQKTSNIIEEIMDLFPDLFDSTFFSLVETDSIENVIEIERLLKESIQKMGYSRFYHLFTTISPDKNIVFRTFVNSFKSLSTSDPQFCESILLNLMDELLEGLTGPLALKLVEFLKPIQQYNLYLACYTVINDTPTLRDTEKERWRKQILDFLLSVMPELQFDKLGTWIKQRMAESPVDIVELCQKFSMQLPQMQKVLEDLINKGFLDAVIIDNKIQPPISEEIQESKADLSLLKQWQVQQDPETKISNITLSIKIKNISGLTLKNINCILILPQNLFVFVGTEKLRSKTQIALDPAKEKILSWTFRKKNEENEISRAVIIKLVMIYQKAEKISSLSRKIDLLLV